LPVLGKSLGITEKFSLRTFTLPNVGHCYVGGARVCWYCSYCCWSL